MQDRPAIFALAVLLALPAAGTFASGRQAPSDRTEEIPETKQELLKRIADLKPKLPPDFSRRLAVISMKIATGWCSPYLTEEFEKDLEALPAGEKGKFADEWKRVRSHPAWPVLKRPDSTDKKDPKKPT